MADKFNLMELLSQRSKGQQDTEEKTEGQQAEEFMPAPTAAKEEVMMIDVCDLVPSKENFYHVDDELKRSIELFGILQPLLVKKPENGKYRVIAGHRRRLAVLSLLNEGKEERRYMPCVFKREDIRDRLAIIMANKFREKTDYEKMLEAIQMEELARDLKKEYRIPGKVREILSELTGQSETQLGRYKAVYNNLHPVLMELFKEDKLLFSVAAELQAMPEEWQQKALEKYAEKEELTLPDIKALKKQQEAETPIPGQMSLETEQAEENTPEEETGQEESAEKPETADNEAEAELQEEPEEEWTEPKPENVLSICYNCDRYEDCHEKKSTVTKCNAFIDRKEARKTEEQKYSEEQNRIDRETKRKLREQAQEEKMNNIPGDKKKIKYVRTSQSVLEEIDNETRPYIILKNTENFKKGDTIRLQAFKDGRATGEILDLYITCLDDENTSSAIAEGYVVAGVVDLCVAVDLGWTEEIEE